MFEHYIKKISKIDGLNIIGCACSLLIGVFIVIISLYLKLHQEYLGLAFIIGSTIYIFFQKELNNKELNSKVLNNKPNYHTHLLISIYLIFFIVSVILLKNSLYHRPTSYFIIIIIISMIILLQIFEADNKYIILSEILLLSINIRMSNYYLFPSIYGPDVNYYINLANTIINESHLPLISNGFYHRLPIMPLTISIIKLLTGLGDKNAYFIIGIIELLSSIFIFLIARFTFDLKTGLLSVLILNLSDYFYLYGFWIIAMSMGIFFVSMLLYMIIKNIQNKFNYMIIISLLAIILTHTITTFVTFVILISILIASEIYSTIDKSIYEKIDLSLVVFFGVSFLSYWIFILSGSESEPFFPRIARYMVKALTESEIGNTFAVTTTLNIGTLSIIMSRMGFILLFSMTIFGLLVILSHKNMTSNRFILAFIFIVILSVIYIPSLFGIGVLLPIRWFVFAYLIICIFAAYGTANMINFKYGKFFASTVILILIFFMITNPLVDSDNIFYTKELTSRTSLYESEIVPKTFIEKANITAVSKNSAYLLDINNSISLNPNPKSYLNKTVLIRKYDFEEGLNLPFSRGNFGEYKKIDSEFNNILNGNKSQIIYDDAEVKIFMIDSINNI